MKNVPSAYLPHTVFGRHRAVYMLETNYIAQNPPALLLKVWRGMFALHHMFGVQFVCVPLGLSLLVALGEHKQTNQHRRQARRWMWLLPLSTLLQSSM